MSRIDDLRALHDLVAMLGLDVAIQDDIKGDCHWDNEFHVNRDWGEGLHLATFQFRPQAELFVAAVVDLPALLDVANAAERLLAAPPAFSLPARDALRAALDHLNAAGGAPATPPAGDPPQT